MSDISLQILQRNFYYDDLTGTLYRYKSWKNRDLRPVKIPAKKPKSGSWGVRCEGMTIPATHVVLWLYFGEKPPGCVHTVNGDWSDLRLTNLEWDIPEFIACDSVYYPY